MRLLLFARFRPLITFKKTLILPMVLAAMALRVKVIEDIQDADFADTYNLTISNTKTTIDDLISGVQQEVSDDIAWVITNVDWVQNGAFGSFSRTITIQAATTTQPVSYGSNALTFSDVAANYGDP